MTWSKFVEITMSFYYFEICTYMYSRVIMSQNPSKNLLLSVTSFMYGDL